MKEILDIIIRKEEINMTNNNQKNVIGLKIDVKSFF